MDLLVNSTSVGRHGEDLPIPEGVLSALPGSALVADLTYRQTALLRAAQRRGNPCLDGSGMLLYQGVRAFELWTGQTAPVDVMRVAFRQGDVS